MLDRELEPSPAREIAHRSKGCLAVIVALSVLVFGGIFLYSKASDFLTSFGEVPDYTGNGRAQKTITIPTGSSLEAIGSLLVEQDIIKSERAWQAAVEGEERSTSVQAGRYLMRTQIPAADALRLLINPGTSRVRLQFTVPEGLRLTRQVDALVKGTKIPRKSYDAALAKPKSLGLPKYARSNPEGLLFPDTYELTGEATATSTLKQMVTQYNAVARQVGLDAAAKRLKRDPYEVLIVASIIEREVNNPADRANVAQVIYNRLDKGQKLEMDSTVAYAENLNTTTTTDKDRRSKSKYNTYRYEGLPPGPISAPGRAALEAAAKPTSGDLLFFVTVNLDTGETKFATKLANHEKNVAQFQAWCQANKGRCS